MVMEPYQNGGGTPDAISSHSQSVKMAVGECFLAHLLAYRRPSRPNQDRRISSSQSYDWRSYEAINSVPMCKVDSRQLHIAVNTRQESMFQSTASTQDWLSTRSRSHSLNAAPAVQPRTSDITVGYASRHQRR